MSNRTYSTAPNDGMGAANFPYIWDSTVLTTGSLGITTGAWRPYGVTDISSVSVSGLSITVGAVAITGSPSVVVAGGYVGLTGNLSGTFTFGTGDSISIANPVLSVSGVTQSNITNTSPIPISGFVNTSVTVGNITITGFSSTIAPLAVSGVLAASVDNTNLILAVNTGNQRLLTNNILLSGVSGLLSSNLIDAAWVTGNVGITNAVLAISGVVQSNITNTAPLAVSGMTTITNTLLAVSGVTQSNVTNTAPIPISGIVNAGNIAITGFNSTIAPLAVSGIVSAGISNPLGVSGVAIDRSLPNVGGFATQFLPIGGRVMNPSGVGSITGYNSTGDMGILNIAQNGGLYVNQAILDRNYDQVTTFVASTGTGPSTTVSGLAPDFFGTFLPNNPNRRGWYFQNIGTGIALVKMSAIVPTSGNFDILVKGATAHFAGDGGVYESNPCTYTGPVSCTGFGGAPIVWRAWEL